MALRFNNWQIFLSQWPGQRWKDAAQGGLFIFADAEGEAIIAGIHKKSAFLVLLQPEAHGTSTVVQLQDALVRQTGLQGAICSGLLNGDRAL